VNIVGYQTLALNLGGFTHIAPTFITIGGSQAVPLSSLTGDFAEFDSIQFIDPQAGTASQYFWLEAGSAAPDASGWYADDFATSAGDTPVAAGVSFLYSSGGATGLTLSGEVGQSDVSVTIGSGFTAIGNPFPVDAVLADFGFTGITEFSTVQLMDSSFTTSGQYFWLEAGSAAPDASGWYADDFATPAGDTPVTAGQGFLVNTDASGVTFVANSPL
jgi:hypothetical protein